LQAVNRLILRRDGVLVHTNHVTTDSQIVRARAKAREDLRQELAKNCRKKVIIGNNVFKLSSLFNLGDSVFAWIDLEWLVPESQLKRPAWTEVIKHCWTAGIKSPINVVEADIMAKSTVTFLRNLGFDLTRDCAKLVRKHAVKNDLVNEDIVMEVSLEESEPEDVVLQEPFLRR